jgi:aspartate racemase
MKELSRLINPKQLAIPGILGGLGPLAHIEFERRLIETNKQRGVYCDQDYPVWILIGASNIPDRTKSLMGEAADCTPWLVRYGKVLELAGADFMVVTCNTAHAFYEQVQPQLSIPWIHLIESTSQYIVEHYPSIRRVGVLATEGTLRSGLYDRALRQVGLVPVIPPLKSTIQKRVMQAIYHPHYGIKAAGVWIPNRVLGILVQAVNWLQRQGAELVIAGCTELSVALKKIKQLSLPWIDPLEVLANVTLDLTFGNSNLQQRRFCA